MKYAYPAIFTPNELDGYCVEFPDIPGCVTQGTDIPDALAKAADALCLMLYDMEENSEAIPTPSEPASVAAPSSGFVSMVYCDTLEYRRLYENKAVKKTLTVPAWLNTAAERQGINFSATLQQALMHQLGIEP